MRLQWQTILPAAQEILPGIVYKLFMIGGPIMAITTLNGVFNDVRYPNRSSTKDGWLPKEFSEGKPFRSTVPDLYLHTDRDVASDHFDM